MRLPLYILAGGRSQRFGSNKALALLDGRPLLLHALEPFRDVASKTTLVVQEAAPYASFGLPCVCDPVAFRGPLQGLATALLAQAHLSSQAALSAQAHLSSQAALSAQAHLSSQADLSPQAHLSSQADLSPQADQKEDGWLLLSSCDLLGLEEDWLRGLLDAPRQGFEAVAFFQPTDFPKARWQGFPALYHRSLLPEVEKRLEVGPFSLWALLDSARTKALPRPFGWSSVAQINTPEDLQGYAVRSKERHPG